MRVATCSLRLTERSSKVLPDLVAVPVIKKPHKAEILRRAFAATAPVSSHAGLVRQYEQILRCATSSLQKRQGGQ